MKKSHVLFFMLFIGSACFAQPGVLDTDFDADGVRLLDIASASDHTFGLAIQPDGNILAAGPTWDGNVDAMAVYRLLPDGSLDNTFGTNGLVISDANLELKKTNALVLQADGKILIGGASGSPSTAFSVVRLTADGSMDPTFGTNGAVTVEVGGYTDVVNDLIVQPDGKIIAVGTTYGGPLNDEYDIAVVRLNSDGSLDNTFSFDGMLVTDVNGYDWALSVELTSEGKILVGGYTEFTQANTNTLLLQYNADGTSDITFGTNGKVETEFTTLRDEFYAIDIASDGSILAAGRLDDGNSLDFLVAKFDSNGALDNTFSFNGYNLTDFDGGNDTGRDLLIQPDSKVLVGGSMSSGDEMTMARYNADGSLDVDFGTNGKVRTIVGTSAVIRKLALQQDGKIMAAGYSSEITSDGLLARYFSGINIGIGDVDAYIGSTLIYPNPITNNTVIVEYELKSVETVSIELYNLKGKRLSTLQSEAQENVGSYQKTLVLPKLSAGSYLLILNTTKGSVSIQLGVV